MKKKCGAVPPVSSGAFGQMFSRRDTGENVRGMADPDSAATRSRPAFLPHRPVEKNPDPFRSSGASNVTLTTFFTSSSSISNDKPKWGSHYPPAQAKQPVSGANVIDVFDNNDLSSDSSSDSDLAIPPAITSGSRPAAKIQIGRIRPAPAAVEKPATNSIRGSIEPPSTRQLTAIARVMGADEANEWGHRRPVHFLKACRPPSRHKSPPKALGLDLPEAPHTPPKTQKDLEEFKEYSHTLNVKGIDMLNKEARKDNDKAKEPHDDDSDSLISSSIEEIQDFDDSCGNDNYNADTASPEIIVSYHGKQITTPRMIPIVPIEAFGARQPTQGRPAQRKSPSEEEPVRTWERPVTVPGVVSETHGGFSGAEARRPGPMAKPESRPVTGTGGREGEPNGNRNGVREHPPTMYVLAADQLYRGKRLLTSSKLRSNTVMCHTKPQNIPFDTGLDAEFLDLFAKD